MEIRNTADQLKPVSKGQVITGRVITALVIAFLLVDAIMKIIRESHSVEGSVKLGWPDESVMTLGILLLVCTIIYSIPRTAVLGAILLTGYLGGAIAIMFRTGTPFYFPIIFGILVWAGVYFRDAQLRTLIPFRNH